MPGQARKRSSDDSSALIEGEVTPEALEEMEDASGREGEEPVIPVEMAEDEEDEDEDEDADEEADEDEDEEDEDDDDEDDDEAEEAQEPEDR
jgi:hypothetical protein